MKIAIGTIREPKVNGIKEGVSSCPYFDKITDIEYICDKVSSDVSDMPLSIEEIMTGAKNRANNLRKKGINADYYVGIEGGTYSLGEKKYIIGVVYSENNLGEGHFGFSASMEVPKYIEDKLYIEKQDLGEVMGELSGRIDIRSENGSFGAWCDDMMTRKDEFSIAFKLSIAPFYNKYFKL